MFIFAVCLSVTSSGLLVSEEFFGRGQYDRPTPTCLLEKGKVVCIFQKNGGNRNNRMTHKILRRQAVSKFEVGKEATNVL